MNAAATAAPPAHQSETPKLDAKAILELLKATWAEWNEDKAPRLGAAFAYYTVFSLSPLLIVIIAIAGAVFGEEAARGQIQREISGAIGPDAAKSVEDMIKGAAERKSTGIFASIAGIATLLLSSSALFGQLQDSLNTIWEVAPKPGQGFMAVVRQRFLSFSMVLGTGFLMLVSLASSAAVSALGTFMGDLLPIPEFLLHIINFVIGFAVTTLLFAMMYKVLPDAEVQWHDVWVGAILTSLLFGIGRFALGMYLGKSGVSSAYGAAGSLVLILLWIYYAAQILFFGAEFTQVYANKFGSKVKPSPHAIGVTDEMRAHQGMPRTSDLQAAAEAADLPGNVPSVEVWQPGIAAARDAKIGKSGHPKSSAIDNRDFEYLMAALAGFAATIFLASRLRRH